MITKNYIKMCVEAKEMQKLCQYEQGDWFINVAHELEVIPCWATEHMKEWYKYYYHKWLPTQEQLQEMSGLSWWDFDQRCNEIRRVSLEDPMSDFEVKTKEGAGICVVMEKYNKFWTGKIWKEVK